MPDLIGQTLGGYRILSQIGKGGMATVYKAFQPSLERYVAVKVLPQYYAQQDETFLKRFRVEAQSIARLRHPNILTIHEYGEENGVTFIVMEYVEAGTLTERLGRPMPLAEIEPILRQVAAALSYAHDQGVIHRDVKPSNILLPKPDWPLLTDFGLAKIVGGSNLTLTGTVAGTPAYMSPEQGRGEAVRHFSDIYSLGIVLFEMTTGVVPYTAETPMAVIVKHIIEPLPLPRSLYPALPESVEAVILKALAKQPEDRYARADEMAQAFTGALEAAGSAALTRAAARPQATSQPAVPAVPGAPPTESRPSTQATAPARRRILPLALIGFAACALVSLGALAVVAGRGGSEPTSPPSSEIAVEGPANTAEVTREATPTFDQLMADGQAMLDQGQLEPAVALFQQALAVDPSNLDLYWEISNRFRDLGYPDYAKGFADAAVAAGPDEAWFHEAAGWHYHDLGADEDSAAQFRRAIELDGEALWSYVGLSSALRALGDFESARVPLDALAGHEPASDPDLYESLGWGYSELGAYPEAQAAFRQAVSLDPTKTGAWSGLIDATYNAEGVSPAWNVATEAVAANPVDASLHHHLGNLASELGDEAGAENAYKAATDLDPAYGPAYISLADLYDRQGRVEDAFAALNLGLERNPEDPWLHEALGKRLIAQGEAEAAVEHFSAAADLEPSYGWFPLQAAQAYFQYTGDVAGTSAFLERAASAQPDDADLLDAIGQVYEAIGDCPSASVYYARALEIKPEIENSQAGLTRCG